MAFGVSRLVLTGTTCIIILPVPSRLIHHKRWESYAPTSSVPSRVCVVPSSLSLTRLDKLANPKVLQLPQLSLDWVSVQARANHGIRLQNAEDVLALSRFKHTTKFFNGDRALFNRYRRRNIYYGSAFII